MDLLVKLALLFRLRPCVQLLTFQQYVSTSKSHLCSSNLLQAELYAERNVEICRGPI